MKRNNRMEASQRHLDRFNEGDQFLNESWMHHCITESKRSSLECRKREELAPTKTKTQQSADPSYCFLELPRSFADRFPLRKENSQ